MNTISKYIYFAEVLGNLQAGLGVVLIVLGVITFLIGMIYAGISLDGKSTSVIKRWFFSSFIPLVLLAPTTVFIPSQKTMLMVAASEAAGVVISSPEARTAMEKVLNKIDKKLSDDK